MAIDFAALAARLLQQSRSLLAEWYPHGKLLGHEFKIGDVYGAEGDSLSINVNTGAWADFADDTMRGGDLVSLYAAREGLSQADAARKLEGDSTIATRIVAAAPAKQEKKEHAWIAVMPVPGDAPQPTNDYYRKGPKDAKGSTEWIKLQFIARWPYLDHDGHLLGYAVRFEWVEGGEPKKDIVPQTYCANEEGKKQWRWKSFPEPRPLYGLDQLRARPTAPVMVLEGEKKVDALKLIAPQYVGVAWAGGAAAWRKTNWLPLKGRAVTCWPDADKQKIKSARQAAEFKSEIGVLIPRDHQPGMRAMWEIGHQLLKQCPTVKIIIPDDESLPDGWDCADAVRDGWDWPRLKAWALPRVFNLTEGGSNASAQQRSAGRSERRDVRAVGGESGRADGARVDQAAAPVASGMVAVEAQPDQDARAQVDRSGRDDEDHGRASRTDRWPAGGPRSSRAGDGDAPAVDAAVGGGERARADGNIQIGAGAQPATPVQRSVDVRAGADQPASAPQSQVGRWLAWNIERNGNGLPIVNLNNAVRVLESDPSLRSLVWFDEFLQRLMTGEPAREWTDADDINLTLYMQREIGISKMGRDTVSQAVISHAMRRTRNCVKESIEATAWDQTARIDEFLIRVFHCDDTPYTRAASRNFWVSMVARVYQPGCKVDNMLVLEGSQGLLKSSALNAIAAPWFAEQHESATNPKAFAEVLQGKLLVEISEMDSFNRAEVNTIKKVVSCQSDRYRASYARYAADHPRQGVMAGSVNKDDWNRDETGARRFWPIRCAGMADIEYVRQARAQCFAEALAALRAGESWWTMPAEETRTQQEQRYTEDAWLEPVGHWLAGKVEVSTNEIAVACLHLSLREVDQAVQRRLSTILGRLGWAKHHTRRGKRWSPPADAYGIDEQLVGTNRDLSERESVSNGSQTGHSEDDIPFQ